MHPTLTIPGIGPVILCCGLLSAGVSGCGGHETSVAPQHEKRLSLAVYVWQRQWDDPVKEAIREAAGEVDAFVVLAGEAQWTQGRPRVAKAGVDYAFLKTVPKPIGVAIRIGEHAGLFRQDETSTQLLESFATQALAEAKSRGLNVAELQIDFDCADSRLADYAFLIGRIKRKTGAVPLVITALPCWLNNAAFADLAKASDGFVLQVHSLEKPESPDQEMTLCDPVKAVAWVKQAGGFGVPFRVALPTYGYLAAFSDEGKLMGISAEGPARSWGDKARLVAVRADPAVLAKLARDWHETRPPGMTGIIWYRLPVHGDRLNWKWDTLSAIMNGRTPIERAVLRVEYPEPSLVEVVLVNEGQIDTIPRNAIGLQWDGGRLVGGDGLSGYEMERAGVNHARLRYADSRPERVVGAGERWKVAWLRFDRKTEVQAHVEKP